ncbi:MAG: hypothetical protein LBS80_02905 [Tannerella sp.]|jgi:hypothetical protein|nr:hypothetical protein [Tannerella sp.]
MATIETSVLRESAEKPQVRHPKIKYDENGIPQGSSLEEFRDKLEQSLSEAYGTDFRKVRLMEEAGMLNPDELTDEMLQSEFKYEPYPGFKPRPRSEYKPNMGRLMEMSAEYDLMTASED